MDIEGKVEASILLDIYGNLMSKQQLNILELSLNQDMTLSEIAEREGISRQGVRDYIVRGIKALNDYEAKLRLSRRLNLLRQALIEIEKMAVDKGYQDILLSIREVISSMEDN